MAQRYSQRYCDFSFFATTEQFLLAKRITLILTKTSVCIPKAMLSECKRIAFELQKHKF